MIAVTKGELTGGRAANDQFAREDLFTHGVACTFNTANHLFNSGIADLPRGLLERGDADASQLCPLKLIETQQADITSPGQCA